VEKLLCQYTANSFWTLCTQFFQNHLSFVEDVTKHFGSFLQFTCSENGRLLGNRCKYSMES